MLSRIKHAVFLVVVVVMVLDLFSPHIGVCFSWVPPNNSLFWGLSDSNREKKDQDSDSSKGKKDQDQKESFSASAKETAKVPIKSKKGCAESNYNGSQIIFFALLFFFLLYLVACLFFARWWDSPSGARAQDRLNKIAE